MGIDKGTTEMTQPINSIDSQIIDEMSLKETSKFSILSITVHSMNNKFQKIRDLTHKLSLSIICLQETAIINIYCPFLDTEKCWEKLDNHIYGVIKNYHSMTL